MVSKKKYIKPELKRIELDHSITLMMQSGPHDPPPLGTGKKGNNSDPFQSPFGSKPFG
jgi:hypothetical protein